MAHRIEIALKRGIRDARGQSAVSTAKSFLRLPVRSCETRDIYKLDVRLNQKQKTAIRKAFTDPVIAVSSEGRHRPPAKFDWLVEVGFKHGVTDNVGRTARVVVEDLLRRTLDADEEVFTSRQYFWRGETLTREQVMTLARDQLANSLIHSIEVFDPTSWAAHPIDESVPRLTEISPVEVKTYDLSGPDDELMKISRDGILSLSLLEMHAIRDHFADPEISRRRAEGNLPCEPTDVEMECIAQTWSEHCKHKIFAGVVHYSDADGNQRTIDSLFNTYIRGATTKIGEEIDWLVSVFTDNAGVIRFSDRYNLVFKVETHNSPSALDPYGGAITGIVGCNRDPMGTGIGSELLYNTWGYCLGSPFYDGVGSSKRVERRSRGCHYQTYQSLWIRNWRDPGGCV